MESRPLLKFEDGVAALAPEGLELVRCLRGPICPVIFIGDGRGGKSYLASRVLGVDDAFTSSDTAEPVTEGIDVAAVPAEDGHHLLVLDCEGGNNAMAAIRTLVNVFGILLATNVVFVANGMASEQALQSLGAALASRALIRLSGDAGSGGRSRLPEQRLTFVVNKNTLRYDHFALEAILEKPCEDPARQELRDAIRDAFPVRDFITVPLMGTDDFEKAVLSLRGRLLEGQRPLCIGGEALSGEQLCGLMDHIVDEVRRTSEVSFPSVTRFVIFDSFLMPITKRLMQEAQGAFPKLDDYDAELSGKDPRGDFFKRFDAEVAHLTHWELVDEARSCLRDRLNQLWEEVARKNDAFGDQVQSVTYEQREVETQRAKTVYGGTGLLRRVLLIKKVMRVESRSVVLCKRGGDATCSEWVDTAAVLTRYEESAFDELPELPVLKGRLHKSSPSTLRSMLSIVTSNKQERICMVKDGFFIWWEPDATQSSGEAKGCINFLVHRAEVVADESCSTVFTIRPAGAGGWSHTTSFTGGENRAFHFDTTGTQVSRDEWVTAIAGHIRFGNLAGEQLGTGAVVSQVGVFKPTLLQLEI